MRNKKKWKIAGAVCLFLCGIAVSAKTQVLAVESLDADYSGAVLAVMSEGNIPQEIPVTGADGVYQVEADKLSYTTDVLTVRELPGTEHAQVGMLSKYAQVQVTGVCSNGWSAVQMENGITGYASSEFLSDVVPEGAENIGESLGVFKVTYYCACQVCCGSWSGGPTASGAYPVADWTLAADPEVLPLGTRVYMNGHEYCVEDTGSGVNGNHIDVYVNDHEVAVQNGVASVELFASFS